jgi:hypothetical protein
LFGLNDVYQFQFELLKLQSKLKSVNQTLNDLEVFDVVLSTPRSGKFIELCVEADASFYKVKTLNAIAVHSADLHFVHRKHHRKDSLWKSSSPLDAPKT